MNNLKNLLGEVFGTVMFIALLGYTLVMYGLAGIAVSEITGISWLGYVCVFVFLVLRMTLIPVGLAAWALYSVFAFHPVVAILIAMPSLAWFVVGGLGISLAMLWEKIKTPSSQGNTNISFQSFKQKDDAISKGFREEKPQIQAADSLTSKHEQRSVSLPNTFQIFAADENNASRISPAPTNQNPAVPTESFTTSSAAAQKLDAQPTTVIKPTENIFTMVFFMFLLVTAVVAIIVLVVRARTPHHQPPQAMVVTQTLKPSPRTVQEVLQSDAPAVAVLEKVLQEKFKNQFQRTLPNGNLSEQKQRDLIVGQYFQKMFEDPLFIAMLSEAILDNQTQLKTASDTTIDQFANQRLQNVLQQGKKRLSPDDLRNQMRYSLFTLQTLTPEACKRFSLGIETSEETQKNLINFNRLAPLEDVKAVLTTEARQFRLGLVGVDPSPLSDERKKQVSLFFNQLRNNSIRGKNLKETQQLQAAFSNPVNAPADYVCKAHLQMVTAMIQAQGQAADDTLSLLWQ